MSAFEQNLQAVLHRAIGEHCELVSVARLTGGASQETYAVDTELKGEHVRYALRRAAGGGADVNDHGRTGLATEARLIRLAAAHDVPEPEILHVLEPLDQLGVGFLMTWLHGETLGSKIARHDDFATIRPRLARQCGEILARIHAIDVDQYALRDHLDELTPKAFVEQQWDRYRALDTPQPMIDFTARWLLNNLPEAQETKLVHNDFRNGNLMVDPALGVTAVLDWEVAHLGDPMRDLGWMCTPSWRFGVDHLEVGGFGQLDDLIAGYESVSGTQVDRDALHFWQVFGAFWWAIGCLLMAEHYRSGPDKTVERPGIGRRSSECQADCVNLLIPGPVPPLPGLEASGDDNMPTSAELLTSVRDFLRNEVSTESKGRLKFLARVASNSLDIIIREQDHDAALKSAEHDRLKQMLESQQHLRELRWRLVNALRDDTIALDDPALAIHLRETVMGQLAIDQPNYPALKKARSN